MIPLTADDTRLLKDVAHFSEPVPVCDPNGKLLGIFVPASRACTKPHFDSADIKRRLQNEKPTGVLFGDVVALLKELDTERKRRKDAGEPDFTHEEVNARMEALRAKVRATSHH
ncbi:hypothetical protein AYO44_02380 [Planctomycetaceae bacterium SCGC AG-212-F19]|nr:hypothetical protein AYO44_02380 [Planctomycetaceae bacterium SCGC AG-212-F19]